MKYIEAIILGLMKGATFLVAIAGTQCDTLTDAGASHSCTSENVYHQLTFPQIKKFFTTL